MTAATLTGFRESHRELLRGNWTPGELLARPADGRAAGRAAMAEPAVIDHAVRSGMRLYVVPGAGFIRYREIDWIHRRARVEIGLRDQAWPLALAVLRQARSAGLELLGLSRLYGWVTPAAGIPDALLADAGFELEATVPRAIWLAGRPVSRQVWATLADSDRAAPAAGEPGPAQARPRLVRLGPAGPHLAPPGASPGADPRPPADPADPADPGDARLVPLTPAQAAARLRTEPGGGRGFLGLDPVTQNDPSLIAGLSAREALVWSFGVALVGACPNPDNPRQACVATTSADPAALRAAAGTLRAYRRTASLLAVAGTGEPAADAVRGCGFTRAGTLRRHDYRSGAYHDADMHYLSLEQPCA
jgi:hypothetical protein